MKIKQNIRMHCRVAYKINLFTWKLNQEYRLLTSYSNLCYIYYLLEENALNHFVAIVYNICTIAMLIQSSTTKRVQYNSL